MVHLLEKSTFLEDFLYLFCRPSTFFFDGLCGADKEPRAES